MQSSDFDYLNRVTEEVQQICHPLRSKTPISIFDYYEIDANGDLMVLTTTPDCVSAEYGEELFPKRYEMEMLLQSGLRMTCMSHLAPLSKTMGETNKEKFENNVAYYSGHKVYHRLFFMDYYGDKLRAYGYGVSQEKVSSFDFYWNNIEALQCFGPYFSARAQDLIAQVRINNKVTFMAYNDPPPAEILEVLQGDNGNEYLLPFKGGFDQKKVLPKLTERETDCLSLVAKGYTIKMVAHEFGLSPRTVEQHLRNIKDKLDVTSKKQLLEYWHEQ